MGKKLKSMANSHTVEFKSRISTEDISGPERFLLGEELKRVGKIQTLELKSRLSIEVICGPSWLGVCET